MEKYNLSLWYSFRESKLITLMHKGTQSLTNKMIKRIYGYDVALQHAYMVCGALIVQNSNTVFVTPFIGWCYKILAWIRHLHPKTMIWRT